jgi:hypothetical protein
MAGTPNKKQQIAGELARDRMQLHDDLLLLRRDLDVRRHIIYSIRDYPWEWVTAGFIVGWLLSRLPARKKKIYIYSDNLEQVKRHRGKTLSKVWEVVWGTSKPLIAAYAAKKLAERIKNSHRRDGYERES